MGSRYIEIYDLVQPSPEDYLMHHGIKNQRWGVRRGPPYPLESGINTKVKTRTKAAEQRAKKKQAKRAAKTAARAEAKERAAEEKREKNKTLQDKINEMSDAELIERTNRLRLENAYKRELPKEKEGQSFLQASAKFLNNLNTAGQAFSNLSKTGKEIAKLFGLVEDKTKNDTSLERLPGESLTDYSKRLASLASIKKLKENLGVGDKVSQTPYSGDDWTKEDPDKKKKGG